MNQQFHTPSFGDEMFELNDTTTDQNSRRMRNLDQSSSMDEYHDTTNTSADNVAYSAITPNTSTSNISVTPTAQPATSAQPTPSTHAVQLETSQALKKQTAIVSPLPQPTTTLSINGTHSSAVSEPAKPMSAYAFFFRDSLNAIKKQNPSCTFQEISVVVSKMWEALDEQQKHFYNERHELSKQEYVTASQNYRQIKLEDQKQDQQESEAVTAAQPAADSQSNATNASEPFATNNINNNTPAPSSPILAPTTAATPPTSVNANETNSLTPQQIQLLTEAAATQKCTRQNCNKPAIINPDWEDEYCSNECVIIHCRTVFSDWVKEMANPTEANTSTTVDSSAGQETST